MAKLVKLHNGVLSICRRVSAPGYSIRVQDYEPGGSNVGQTPPDGWQVMPDDTTEDDFVLPWVQPTGADNAYQYGAVVLHANNKWRSLINANVWQPGVSAWVEITTGVPVWVQPTGAHDTYPLNAVVTRNSKVWRSMVNANVWEPGVSAWRETAITPPGVSAPIPAWVQPTGAQDAYQIGDRVTYNGNTWVCAVANNVWEPGVYGWNVV